MSVIKIKNGKRVCSSIKDYLEKNNRDKRKTAYGCDKETWDQEMQVVKELEEKVDGRQYYHVIQAIDHRSGDVAHNLGEIHAAGQELAQYWVKQGYQVVVVTHNDKENWHNHLIINSVNAETGMKMDMHDRERYQLFKLQEEIDRSHGFWTMAQSIAENKKVARAKGVKREARRSDEIYTENRVKKQNKKTRKQEVREKLQSVFAKEDIFSREDFEKILADKGLQISRETSTGHITYQRIDKLNEKHRASRLGDFDTADIAELIARNQEIKLQLEAANKKEIEDNGREESRVEEPNLKKKIKKQEVYRGWIR